MRAFIGIILCLVLLVGAGDCVAGEKKDVSNFKGKIVMLIAPRDFRDEELLIPRKIFQENGYKVVVASLRKGVCVGMLGTKVNVSTTVDQINSNDYSALVLVGGVGSTVFFNNTKVQNLAIEFYKQGKVVSAICLAPVTLANAGLLKDKKATVWRSEAKRLVQQGAKYVSEDVVSDEGIVTGAGPFAAEKFAYEVLSELEKADKN